MGISGLRSSVVRFNFCNGGQDGSPQFLPGHTARTLPKIQKLAYGSCLV